MSSALRRWSETQVALAVVLAAMSWALGPPWLAVVVVGLLGVTAHATAAPLQLRMREQAGCGSPPGIEPRHPNIVASNRTTR